MPHWWIYWPRTFCPRRQTEYSGKKIRSMHFAGSFWEVSHHLAVELQKLTTRLCLLAAGMSIVGAFA